MAKSDGLKMARQLQIYDMLSAVRNGAVYGPADIMNSFGIGPRMLQRDLKDLRDCGLIKLNYNKAKDRYVLDGDAAFDETASPRRRQHLIRLYRLGTLIHALSRTDSEKFEHFRHELEEFYEYLEDTDDSPEEIAAMREFYILHDIEFYDLKYEYYELFPDSNERTRQRDFLEMRRAGFNIYYSREFGSFIYEYDFKREE